MVGGGDEAERERERVPAAPRFSGFVSHCPKDPVHGGGLDCSLAACKREREREREPHNKWGAHAAERLDTPLKPCRRRENIHNNEKNNVHIYIYISEIQTPSHVDMRSMITGNNFYQSHMTCRTRFTGRAVVVDVKGQFGITCAEDDLDVTCLDFTLHWHTCQNSRRLRGRRPSPET